MRWCFAIVAVTGCGRFDFDASPDASPDAPAHDEDGDGIADARDDCPHRPDPLQTDSDGDGVGDACDPDPTTRESIAFFDPFTAPRSEWTYDAPTFPGDVMRLTALS